MVSKRIRYGELSSYGLVNASSEELPLTATQNTNQVRSDMGQHEHQNIPL